MASPPHANADQLASGADSNDDASYAQQSAYDAADEGDLEHATLADAAVSYVSDSDTVYVNGARTVQRQAWTRQHGCSIWNGT